MNKTTKTIIWIVVIALVIWGIVAISNNNSNDIDLKNKKEVNIGAVLPITGPGSFMGEYYNNSIMLANDYINLNNIIEGYKLNVLIEDGETNPQKSLSAARSLVSRGVNILFTAFRGPSLAISSYANNNEKLLIANTAVQLKNPLGEEFFFLVGGEVDVQIRQLAEYAKNNNCSSMATIVENTDFGIAAVDITDNVFGAENSFSDLIQFGENTQFESLITKLENNNPDCWLVYAQSTASLNILQTMEQMGLDKPLYSTSYAINSSVLQEAPQSQLSNVIYSVEGFYENKNKKTKQFVEDYRDKFSSEPHVFGVIMYDIVNFTAEAMNKCISQGQEPDNVNCVKRNLEESQGYQGLIGQYNMTKTHDIPILSYSLWEVEEREPSLITVINEN
ncbi:MAG: ABC transporter substrate-binding protein [Candidatus Paceibacterota bacterium]